MKDIMFIESELLYCEALSYSFSSTTLALEYLDKAEQLLIKNAVSMPLPFLRYKFEKLVMLTGPTMPMQT
jgi:hypothetical protein